MIIQEILSGFDLYLAKLELSEKNIEITLKGTVSVISCEPSCKDVQFTSVPLKP